MTEPETKAAPPEKRVGTTRWMVLGGIVLALAGLGVVWLLRASPKRAAPTTRSEVAKVKSVLHLDTFVMNLADPEEKAYLRVGIDLGLGEEQAKEGDGAAPVALVRDTILGVLAQCKPDELLTPEGKTKLKADLRRALRQRAPQLQVEEVYVKSEKRQVSRQVGT
ncbi:MAG TPA: flagellar basal body-associated FliL family protein [Terriglobales bacterium]|nr:flagellar basal body-associated FliL family protein [Terriglobales bacterium]